MGILFFAGIIVLASLAVAAALLAAVALISMACSHVLDYNDETEGEKSGTYIIS